MAEKKHANLAAALAAFQAGLPKVHKGATNTHFKSKYAALEDIVSVVLPALAAQGLAWITRPTQDEGQLVLAYELRHESGESVAGAYPLGGGNHQQLGSAITYARRYCLSAVTGIAPDEDDDGNAAAQAPAPTAARAKPKRDYNGEVAAAVGAKDAAALRDLWKAAQADGAPAEFLDGIRQHVAAIEAAA